MQVEYKVVFNRKKKANRNGKFPVEIQAYQDRVRKYFNTGISITEKEWKGVEKLTSTPQFNLTIRAKLNELQSFEFKCRALNNNEFKLSDFDKLKTPKTVKAISQTFMQFFEQQLVIEKKNIGYATWRQQHTNFRIFKKFAGKDLEFEGLTFDLIQRFDFYMKDTMKLKQNTIWKRHGQLRKYILLAVRHDLLAPNKNPYLKFKAQTELTNKAYLNKEEIERFENLTFTPEQRLLEIVRDMFLFSCFTGLRYSDVNKLKKENFFENSDGLTLKFVAEKTGKEMEVPLFLLFGWKPENIVKKYFRNDGKRLFFGMTNQKANKILKSLSILTKNCSSALCPEILLL